MIGFATHGLYRNTVAMTSNVGLVTLTTMKSVLGITNTSKDTDLRRMISAVGDAMAQIACCRTWHYEDSITDTVKGYGGSVLITPRAPLKSIASVSLMNVDGTVAYTYDSDTYRIDDSDAGVIYRPAGWDVTWDYGAGIRLEGYAGTEARSIRVIYAAGYVTPQQVEDNPLLTRDLPYDLEQAAIESVTQLYSRAGNDPSIVNKSTAQVSTTWNSSMEAARHILTPGTIAVAEAYKRCE